MKKALRILLWTGFLAAAPAIAQEDEGSGTPLYVGLAYTDLTTDFQNEDLIATFGGKRLDADVYVLRLGLRMFDVVGVELQAGAGSSADGSGDEVEISQYAGLYLAPTATIAEMFEVSARVGYAYLQAQSRGGGKENLDGVSYGLGVELPLGLISQSMSNFRLTSAGQVYQVDHDSRAFGWQAGLRYDFRL